MVDARAQHLYDRRVGVKKSLELTVVPQPWIEPGDCLEEGMRIGHRPHLEGDESDDANDRDDARQRVAD